jgi:hypothetical protein
VKLTAFVTTFRLEDRSHCHKNLNLYDGGQCGKRVMWLFCCAFVLYVPEWGFVGIQFGHETVFPSGRKPNSTCKRKIRVSGETLGVQSEFSLSVGWGAAVADQVMQTIPLVCIQSAFANLNAPSSSDGIVLAKTLFTIAWPAKNDLSFPGSILVRECRIQNGGGCIGRFHTASQNFFLSADGSLGW